MCEKALFQVAGSSYIVATVRALEDVEKVGLDIRFMPFDALPAVAYSGHHSMLTLERISKCKFFLACHE